MKLTKTTSLTVLTLALILVLVIQTVGLAQSGGGTTVYIPMVGRGPQSTPVPTQPPPTTGGTIVVNHNSVALFDRIPEQYITAARNMRMVFMDRSVGQNINESLDCLAATSWASSPSACRRDYISGNTGDYMTYGGTELANGSVPARIQFSPSPTRYSRANWVFEFQQLDSWEGVVEDFLTRVAPAHSSRAVLTYQFNYLLVDNTSNIASSTNGFFVDLPRTGTYNNRIRWDISDIEAWQAQNPNKLFFHWTTSLARSIGTPVSTNYNNQVRAYVNAHGGYLFDVADILSYDDLGRPCYDNNNSDGANYPALCSAYTTETQGGHLGAVSAGKIRIAKAFWVLMAQIAGWRP